MKDFTHLHVHSDYSLLDGLARIDDLIEKALEYDMKSLALTDHGVMYGAYEFWKKCKEVGIKPIIGVEEYIAHRTRFDRVPKIDNKRYHVLLLAKNFNGYQNLLKMVSKSHLEGYYYKPRIDKELMKKYGKDIIATSACLGGIVNNQLLNGKTDKAREWALFMKETFDEFYIEIQRNGMKEADKVIPKQVELARELDIPIVASCDTHYINKDEAYIQEILWAIGDGKKMDDDTRRTAPTEEFYLKSQEEMADLYKDIPEALENTKKIEEQIEEYKITFERIQPQYDQIPQGKTAQDVLRKKAFEGAKNRYGEVTQKIEDRINYELEIIHNKGYDDYFLVVQDYVLWSKDQGIIVGPGRGSGAGSVVAYCLEITNLDPFKFELYFERFLNPERPSPPDFDIDFQDDRRDELFKYMTDKYGKENTAFIGTFGRMKTRAAIRDVARVMDIDLEVADKLSKMVEVKFGRVKGIDDMIKDNAEFKKIINSNHQLKKLAEVVTKAEGVARHVSTHACGYLVTPEPIVNFVPIRKEAGGGDRVITQFEGSPLEKMGLMKFDFLGLKNLTIIKNTINLIEESHGKEIDPDEIPLDDEETYKLFQRGDTTAVFQFESDGMRKYLKELKPTEFEDLIFLVAAYRPGPMKYIPDYIARKFGKQKVEYLHEDLKPILKNTYGFAIYQEQVLRIAVDMAGYSLGGADILRRAMGKKKPKIMKQQKKKFIKGCKKQGYGAKLAKDLFSYIEPFADYGFNRSHAACYALISYQTAYLKTHYPVEFLAGLMKTDLENSDKITRDLLEADRMGVKVLPPNINKSAADFKIEGERKIRFGLAAIKNVGRKVVSHIIKERDDNGDFENLDDLIQRVGSDQLSKRPLEYMIKAGAMKEFSDNRNALLEIMPQIVDRVSQNEKKISGGQKGLFDNSEDTVLKAATPIPEVSDEGERQKLEWERELIGTFLTTHPLKRYQKYFGEQIITVEKALTKSDKRKVFVGGLLSKVKKITTRRGNKEMAFVTIEHYSDKIEGVIFNSVYEKFRDKLTMHKPFVFCGSISEKDDSKSIIIEDIKKFSYFKESLTGGSNIIKLDISNETDPTKLKLLKQVIVDNPGSYFLEIYYNNKGNSKMKKKIKKRIDLTPTVKEIIQDYLITD